MIQLFQKKMSGGESNELGMEAFLGLVKVLEDGVVLYAADFTILSVNRSAERILGIQKENVERKKIAPDLKGQEIYGGLIETIFPSLAPVVVQISESGWPQITDMELEIPPLKLRTTLTPLVGRNGGTVGFVKIIRDKTRENELFASKREFLDVTAHQLRTPLTAMGWAFESLAKELEGNPNAKQIADQGKNLTEHSLKIINDLLDATRIEGGKFGYTFAEVNLTELIGGLAREAGRVAEAWGITLTHTPPAEPIMIQGDVGRITMALSNILDNAIKYNTEHGNISVSVEKDAKEPFVKVIIQDTGIGIPEKEMGMLFRKFTRGEKAKELEPNGSGLGLYIAKNIAKNHGGDVLFQSIPSRGSIVTVTFPTDPRLRPKRETTYENE